MSATKDTKKQVIEDIFKRARQSRLCLEEAIITLFGDEKYYKAHPLLERIAALELAVEEILFPLTLREMQRLRRLPGQTF